MKKTYLKEVPAFQFHLLQKFSDQIDHAVFSRHGGTSSSPYDTLNVRFGIGDQQTQVKKNRSIILDSIHQQEKRLVSADQTHSNNVQIIDNDFLLTKKEVAEISDTDALITQIPELPIMVQVADCQALLMYEPEKKVIAAVHAGWKGLVQDISGETIKLMKNNFNVDPAKILIGIAPSLGPCCAFFSNPEKELPIDFHPYIDKKKRVNLWEYSLMQLQKHGIQMNNIELAKVCTQCNGKEDFFSFRRDHGITGRFGVVVAIRG